MVGILSDGKKVYKRYPKRQKCTIFLPVCLGVHNSKIILMDLILHEILPL
jgi:hypothetical protein